MACYKDYFHEGSDAMLNLLNLRKVPLVVKINLNPDFSFQSHFWRNLDFGSAKIQGDF